MSLELIGRDGRDFSSSSSAKGGESDEEREKS